MCVGSLIMETFSSVGLGLAVQSFLNLSSFKNLGTLVLLCLYVFPVEFKMPYWDLMFVCGMGQYEV